MKKNYKVYQANLNSPLATWERGFHIISGTNLSILNQADANQFQKHQSAPEIAINVDLPLQTKFDYVPFRAL